MKSAMPDNLTVRELVRQYVDRHQPQDGYRLRVPDNAVRYVSHGVGPTNDYFIVAVEPDGSIERRFDYYDRLQDIEEDIEAHESMRILIVPAIPGDL